MKKLNNIKCTLQVIHNLPLSIPYQQVEKWVMEYDKKPMKPQKVKQIKLWLSTQYKLFTRRKK